MQPGQVQEEKKQLRIMYEFLRLIYIPQVQTPNHEYYTLNSNLLLMNYKKIPYLLNTILDLEYHGSPLHTMPLPPLSK